LQIFEELADKSKESQQLPMMAMVMGRRGYYQMFTLQQLPLLMHGEVIEREVSEEMAEELREHRLATNTGRPDGHGGVIFVGLRFQN
jgi:hypothetical protein